MSVNSNIVITLALLQARQQVLADKVVQAYIDDPVKLAVRMKLAHSARTIMDTTRDLAAYAAGTDVNEITNNQWPNGFFNREVRGTANGQLGWVRGFTVELVSPGATLDADLLAEFLDCCQLQFSSNGGVKKSVYLREGFRYARNEVVEDAGPPIVAPIMGQPSQDTGPKHVFTAPIPWACAAASLCQLAFTTPTDWSAAGKQSVFVITLYPFLANSGDPTQTDAQDYVLGAGDPGCGCDDVARKITVRRQMAKNANAGGMNTPARLSR